MLSHFPVNTSFFKLHLSDAELMQLPEIAPEVRSEIDLSLSKLGRIIHQQIAESSDRVMLHQAMKHLVVTCNVLIFVGKRALKVYLLDRYVVNRDGDGNLIEVVTVESVHRTLLQAEFQKHLLDTKEKDSNAPGADGPRYGVGSGKSSNNLEEADFYTWAKLQDGQWKWCQEADGKPIPGTDGSSTKNIAPWLSCVFNVVDGEPFGRDRVEEFLGDLTSLENLVRALGEGSAAAAKVILNVSPSASTKPQSLARASNGAIIQGRPDDVGVIQVWKTADFKTV